MIRPALSWLRGDAEIDRLAPPAATRAAAVPFVAMLLGFFASLLLGLALAAGSLAEGWQGAAGDVATLQVYAGPEEIEEQARAALDVLKATPGVSGVRMMDLAEQERLLEPWIGPDLPLESLPLPVTIEIATDRSTFDAVALADALRTAAPGAVLDDHAAWRRSLVTSAERLRAFAYAGLALTGLILAATVGLAARGALAAGAPAVRTLRLAGARDGLIGRAFTRSLARAAGLGVLAGTAAGMALLRVLPQQDEAGFFLIGIGLSGWHWILPLMIPPAALAIAWAASTRAARRSLRSWS